MIIKYNNELNDQIQNPDDELISKFKCQRKDFI